MNKTGWIIFSAVVVVLLGGLVVWTRVTNPPLDVSGVQNNSIIAASEQNGEIADHVTGSDAEKILLIEYGDYQCPSCGGAYPNVKTLLEDYGSDVTLVFRNFPLTSIHPNALAAASAAEAAGLQGKYWEMHDKLYQNQSEWSNLDTSKRTVMFKSYASSLGLDIDKFESDLAGKQVSQKITFDTAVGKSVNVNATPTFFLNGEKLDDETSSGIVQGDLTKIKAKFDALVK
jgi:protein-disulfide isomerase